MKMTNVILSGGVGSRLWPLSRKSKPKQYLPLFEGKTLFQLAIARNLPFCETQMVVGNIDNFSLSRSNFEALNLAPNYEIIEAVPRNTAAAIAFAAFAVPLDRVLLVCPSDHVIVADLHYKEAVERAYQLALEGNLVTFGIEPKRPETGYGYIEYENESVLSFREKPAMNTAKEMLESQRFLWNSGIFCFKAKTYLEELQRFEPEIYRASLHAWQMRAENSYIPLAPSLLIPSKSIDYAVMEKSTKVKVVASKFKWSDLGCFEAVWDYLDEQKVQKNLVLGSVKHVEFVGVENLIYVETADAVLIVNSADSQAVKQVFERLEKENPTLLD